MIYGVTYSNQRVSAADHAKLFRMVIGDGVMNGCGCSYRYDKFTISAGQFIVCGRLTGIEGSEVIDITGNSGYARIRGIIDMDQVAEIDSFGQFYWRVDYASSADGFAALIQEDVNAHGKIYEIEWAVVSLGEGGITGVVRSIANAEGGGGSGEVTYITESLFSFMNGQTAANYEYYGDGTENWEIALLDSGTFKFLANPGLIDVFVVGAGGTGGTGITSGGIATAGAGGNGGECCTFENVNVSRNNQYQIQIGVLGNDTEAFDGLIARGGNSAEWSANNGKAGGLGSQCNSSSGIRTPVVGSQGDLAFNGNDTLISTITGTYFGSSGGGGGSARPGWTQQSGAYGGVIKGSLRAGSGGSTSGGASDPGASVDQTAPNTGAGGGGGAVAYNNSAALGGSGGSGIVIIRNHRSNPAA